MLLSIVGVLQSLLYTANLKSATLLDKANEKISLHLKKSRSLHIVNLIDRDIYAPSPVNFKDWLENKTKAHLMNRKTRVSFVFLGFLTN